MSTKNRINARIAIYKSEQLHLAFDPQKSKEILRFSPVAWQHISFIGKYEFYDNKELIDIQEVIKNLLAEFENDNSSEEPYYKGLQGGQETYRSFN